MKCPYCIHSETEVVETRDSEDLASTRRRRECKKCSKRFTTYERVERAPLIVIKKHGQREQFDRQKLRGGILKASEKTTLTAGEIERIVDDVERDLRTGDSVEIDSKKIGQAVAKRLKKVNKVAYIRFSSVFMEFLDVEDFEKEVHKLL